VLNEAIGGLLPAAVAVALSPIPIAAIVVVLDGPRARSSGPAFAAGWILGLAAVSVIVVFVAGAIPDADASTGVNWVTAGIGVLFLVMAAKQWTKRPRGEQEPVMPGWMATLGSVTPTKGVLLGAALSGANPKNLALTIAASAAIGSAGLDGKDSAIAVATFVAIGSATVAGAVVVYLAFPARAARPLAAIKQFMIANNATIMMVILILLGIKFLGDALAGA
jgi:hypothetical protein